MTDKEKEILEDEVKRLRKCLLRLFVDMHKAEESMVNIDGYDKFLWDYEVEEGQLKIMVALYGAEKRTQYYECIVKAEQELKND